MMPSLTPRLRRVKPPCGRFCPARTAGCSTMCCNWTLYESIRNYLYVENGQARKNLELDLAAQKQVNRADNQVRRRKHYGAK